MRSGKALAELWRNGKSQKAAKERFTEPGLAMWVGATYI